jgi:hypothetical protein
MGRTCECASGETEKSVCRRICVSSAVPAVQPSLLGELWRRLAILGLRLVGLLGCRHLAVVDTEHARELAEHEAKHARGDAECRAEHDPDVPHRHLVDVCVLNNPDQVRGQRAEEAVVRDWERGDELRELVDALLRIDEVWAT